MPNIETSPGVRGAVAGILAWVFPGLGHYYLKHRGRALVFAVVITVTFWTGVAVGGVRYTVDPKDRSLWFVAQMGTGINALGALVLHRANAGPTPAVGPYLSSEVGVHYTGVAGLLNLLVILDAIGRSEPSRSQRRTGRGQLGGAFE